MARYRIDIDNEDSGADGGDWTATLIELFDMAVVSETISVGIGYTAREAVANLDWHHDWTRYQIERGE